MIPFIIGGVALAATGYGVAKLLEDEYPSRGSAMDESSKKLLKEWLDDGYEELKKEVEEYPTQEFTVNLDEKAYEPEEDESLGQYDLAKIELYNTTFIELTTALKEIQNLPQEVHTPERLKFAQTIYPFEKVSEELEKDFDKHTEILQNAKQYIDSKLDTLDVIIINGTDFEKYSDDDKKLVQNLVEIFKLVNHAVWAKTTNDGVSIAREVKRAFSKVETLVENS